MTCDQYRYVRQHFPLRVTSSGTGGLGTCEPRVDDETSARASKGGDESHPRVRALHFSPDSQAYHDTYRKCDSLEAQLSRLREMARKTSEAIPKQVLFLVSVFRSTVVELFSRQVMKCLLHRTRYVPSMSQVQARAYGALITRFVAATLASLVARGRH
jgi:hypothetical protein